MRLNTAQNIGVRKLRAEARLARARVALRWDPTRMHAVDCRHAMQRHACRAVSAAACRLPGSERPDVILVRQEDHRLFHARAPSWLRGCVHSISSSCNGQWRLEALQTWRRELVATVSSNEGQMNR